MSLRLPFFGLVAQRSPMQGLLQHYDQIAEGTALIEEALECYIAEGAGCEDTVTVYKRIGKLEDAADRTKRSIRNHLPRGLFMPVDKALFLNYTSRQDDILDDAQSAMHWLMMRNIRVPERFQKDLIGMVDEVTETVRLLRLALQYTVDLVHGKSYDRTGTKETYNNIRAQHKKVWKLHIRLMSDIFNSDGEFKDVYQLVHFVERLYDMSHNAEGCGDILRAMIAR